MFALSARVCAAISLSSLTLLMPLQAGANDGVEVGSTSKFARLIPAGQIEQSAAQQYQQMLRDAASKGRLIAGDHPQMQRLRRIAERIVPFAAAWNPRAKEWRWEVNIINSSQLNAFCMPGGKIAFYSGILAKLELTDDEVAMIMGHEVAHALREHARERMGKQAATSIGANVLGQVLGVGNLGAQAIGMGAQLLTLKFGREDESEADLVGLELAARAGYDPKAGISLWQKMGAANNGAPPQWLSTHPSGPTRIKDISDNIPKVAHLYEISAKPSVTGPIVKLRPATSASASSP